MNDERIKALREMGERDCTPDFNAHDHHLVMVAAAEIERLRNALQEVTQTLVWNQWGECRGFSENLLTVHESVDLARKALGDA